MNLDKPIRKQVTRIDLATFEDVVLVKEAPPVKVASVEDGLAQVNGDTAKLVEVIAIGLRTLAGEKLVADSTIPWHTFKLDETGEETTEINGPYTGQAADSKVINPLILTLAKTMEGYGKHMSKDEKRTAKENTKAFIRDNPKLIERLVKQANEAPTVEEED